MHEHVGRGDPLAHRPLQLVRDLVRALQRGTGGELQVQVDVARAAGLTEAQVWHVWSDIQSKRKATRYLHAGPQLVEPVGEVTL